MFSVVLYSKIAEKQFQGSFHTASVALSGGKVVLDGDLATHECTGVRTGAQSCGIQVANGVRTLTRLRVTRGDLTKPCLCPGCFPTDKRDTKLEGGGEF